MIFFSNAYISRIIQLISLVAFEKWFFVRLNLKFHFIDISSPQKRAASPKVPSCVQIMEVGEHSNSSACIETIGVDEHSEDSVQLMPMRKCFGKYASAFEFFDISVYMCYCSNFNIHTFSIYIYIYVCTWLIFSFFYWFF